MSRSRRYPRERLATAFAACLAGGLLWAPASQAVTIGAPLDLPANNAEGCETVVFPSLRPVIGVPATCTFFGLDSAGAWTSQTPRGRWVITQGRVRTGPRVGPMVFTVIRAMRSQASPDGSASGAICCIAAAESQVFTPQPNTVNTVPVRLAAFNSVELVDGEPVEIVDYLGITLLSPASSVPIHFAAAGGAGSTANTSFIAPAMRLGQQRLSDGSLPSTVALVNGEFQPAGSGPVPPAPIVRNLDLERAAFAAAARGPSVRAAKRRRVPVGTKVSYRLSEAATTTFTVERRKAGRRVRGKCRKRTRRNAARKKCNLRLKGSFRHKGSAGANSFRFTGRLRKRALRPGRYNLVARARNGTGKSAKLRRTQFRIVRR